MSDASQSGTAGNLLQPTPDSSQRLYYLDWLRLFLIIGVFLYHALHPFDSFLYWHIKNAEQSDFIVTLLLLINPWGMPLFFLVAGCGSWFALRRRSNRQFITERINRLLIPFIAGCILLTPIQEYLEAIHHGTFQGSFSSFIPEMLARNASEFVLSPHLFGRWGMHLWFLAFLFAYCLLGLPVFNWFRKESGQRFISRLGDLVEKRGGILIFIIPLTLSRVVIQPFFPGVQHGWLDFVYSLLFFIFGYIFFTDERIVKAVRRDRWLLFGGGMFSMVAYGGLYAAFGDITLEWGQGFVMPWSPVLIFIFVLMSWCFAIWVFSLAMTGLDFTNRWRDYGNGTIMPFYVFHQPVIIAIAFFVVQWNAGLAVKIPVVVISSFFITFGLIELLIRPFKPARTLLGMKPRGG
ncbi:acyltransferase family protein [Gemmatimonadota bacterium]